MNDRLSSQYNITCRRILEFLRSELALSGCVIYHINDDGGSVEFIAGSLPGVVEGKSNTALDKISHLIHAGLCDCIVPDISQSVYVKHDVFDKHNPVAIVATPVAIADNSIQSLICGVSFDKCKNNLSDHRSLLEFCKSQTEQVRQSYLRSLDDSHTIEILTDQAYFDAMTGLLNRNGWEASIATTIGEGFGMGMCASVFVVDVDGLKALNDTSGHAAGDEAIRKVASALKPYFKLEKSASSIEMEPFVARTGGDEFIGLLFDCNDETAGVISCEISNELLMLGVSVSIGFASCRSARRLPEAIVNADEAMYAQKTKVDSDQSDRVA